MEKTNEIWPKWIKFKKCIGKLYTNSNNPFYKSKYADLSAVLDVIQDKLLENGLDIVFNFDSSSYEKIGIIPAIISDTGESLIMGTLWMPCGNKGDPQDVGKTITYGRRFYLLSLVNLAQEDDDGNDLSISAKRKYEEDLISSIKDIKEANKDDLRSVYEKILSRFSDAESQAKIVRAKEERKKELGI